MPEVMVTLGHAADQPTTALDYLTIHPCVSSADAQMTGMVLHQHCIDFGSAVTCVWFVLTFLNLHRPQRCKSISWQETAVKEVVFYTVGRNLYTVPLLCQDGATHSCKRFLPNEGIVNDLSVDQSSAIPQGQSMLVDRH